MPPAPLCQRGESADAVRLSLVAAATASRGRSNGPFALSVVAPATESKGHANARGCPVASITDIHKSIAGSTCLRVRVASGIGTCTKRPCQRPINVSVLPAIAACTALRAMFQQYTLSDGVAGTLRIV